jgi:hypothetical protein
LGVTAEEYQGILDLERSIEKWGLMRRFECHDVGERKGYIGCKINQETTSQRIKLIQLLILRGFKDEFKIKGKYILTPAIPGETLMESNDMEYVDKKG